MPNIRKFDWGKITEEVKKQETKQYQREDGVIENLYTPSYDKSGVHNSIIRFLPRPEGDGDGIPWAKIFRHKFMTSQGFYVANCPTTLGQPCPICEENKEEWNNGDKNVASTRKRQLEYYSNILVVKDPQVPENEGKVFIYKYGKTLHEKITEKMIPDELDENAKPVAVFDYVEGMNFKLRIKKVKATINDRKVEVPNYDSSEFTGTISKVGTVKEIESIEEKLFKLSVIDDVKKFMQYDKLKDKFFTKIGKKVDSSSSFNDESNSEPEVTENKDEEEPKSSNTSVMDEEDSEFFDNL